MSIPWPVIGWMYGWPAIYTACRDARDGVFLALELVAGVSLRICPVRYEFDLPDDLGGDLCCARAQIWGREPTYAHLGMLGLSAFRICLTGLRHESLCSVRDENNPMRRCVYGVPSETLLAIVQNPAVPQNSFTQKSRMRWFVCGLLFLATTINYMDRSVFSLIEPKLHDLSFMGWDAGDPAHTVFNNHFGNVLICFQVAYGLGLLVSGRVIDRLGTKLGYALAIAVWALSSMSHALVSSVAGFGLARFVLGIGESGNFPAALKATSEWFPQEERAFATGLWNSGTNLSSIVAPLLIPYLVTRFGWHAAFLTTGSFGLLWLVLWLVFPYNRLRRRATQTQKTQADLPSRETGVKPNRVPLRYILRSRGTWAFSAAKALTDPIWWFYLFWLPKYFHENYGLSMTQLYKPLIAVYLSSSVGSIAAGYLAGALMRSGMGVDRARKLTMLICACCVLPVGLVPYLASHGATLWPTIALFSLAAAAHQGWSANLFSTPGDMLPSTAVSTVVGIGGAAGAGASALFTVLVKHNISTHPLVIFLFAASAYVLALFCFNLIVPRLGQVRQA